MIQTFDELLETAQSAKDSRLDKSAYRGVEALLIENAMLARNYATPTLKGFLVKFMLLRRIRCILRGGGLGKNYPLACAYSDALLDDFHANTKEYQQSYEMLSDEWSRLLFVNLLAGEMLIDRRYGIPFQQSKQGGEEYYCVDLPGDACQYEAFINEGEIMVDCGAYIGDTLQEFINEDKVPKKYFGFEPDPDNFQKAKQSLSASGVMGSVYNAGVYKCSRTLRFSSGGRCGRMVEDGELSVDVLAIDDVIKEPVTLIKMDIEGSEYEALEGAASIISAYKPRLAISIYHKPTDFRKIPLLVKQLNDDYSQFYIRYLSTHYTGLGFIETVLFAR